MIKLDQVNVLAKTEYFAAIHHIDLSLIFQLIILTNNVSLLFICLIFHPQIFFQLFNLKSFIKLKKYHSVKKTSYTK